MSRILKIAAYIVLVISAIWLGTKFASNYNRMRQPVEKTMGTNENIPTSLSAGNFHHRPVYPVVMYGAVTLLSLLGLGFLVGRDMSHFFATRIQNLVFNDEGEGIKNPEYEHAEQVWADGKPLEAIQLMRDYLKDHPREQFVALRIAEIYEKDLDNYLAAALEYEEILKKRLPSERWGWAAIHLANIYSGKLGKLKEAEKLLHRIVDDYGKTLAAKKARQRLGIPEPVTEEEAAEPTEDKTSSSAKETPSTPVPPASNLPPGFRPKGG